MALKPQAFINKSGSLKEAPLCQALEAGYLRQTSADASTFLPVQSDCHPAPRLLRSRLGLIGFVGFIGLVGFMGLIGLIGLVGLIGLIGFRV